MFTPLWIILLAGAVFLTWAMRKSFKHNGSAKTFAWIFGALLVVYSGVGILGNYGIVDLGSNAGLFLATTGAVAPSTGTSTNTNNNGASQNTGGSNLIIGTLKAKAQEKYSNSYTNVGNGNGQYLKIYDANTDPSSPTASYIDRINITSGSGSTTSKLITTGTPYRVVFDGANVWYDKDFGVMSFNSANYNVQTSELLFDIGTVSKISNITSALNGTATDGTVNGQTTSSATNEINTTASTATEIRYDKAVGDGQFYISPTVAFSGAYTESKNPVLCFEWDTSTPPEGNEVSSITYQLTSGTDFKMPSELVSYWSTQQCILLGQTASGGTSSTFKLTFTMDESQITASDDVFYMYVDDLGKIRGKDAIVTNIGASPYKLKFSFE